MRTAHTINLYDANIALETSTYHAPHACSWGRDDARLRPVACRSLHARETRHGGLEIDAEFVDLSPDAGNPRTWRSRISYSGAYTVVWCK